MKECDVGALPKRESFQFRDIKTVVFLNKSDE